jgi:hypothetical protein
LSVGEEGKRFSYLAVSDRGKEEYGSWKRSEKSQSCSKEVVSYAEKLMLKFEM